MSPGSNTSLPGSGGVLHMSKGCTNNGVTRTTNSCSPEVKLSFPPVRPMIGRSPHNGIRFDVPLKLFWIKPATVSVCPSRSSTVVLNWRWAI